jgi:predicted dehydrogenase
MTGAPVRVALVGCGAIAELGHAPALLALPQAAVVTAVADTSPQRRDLLGAQLGVPPGQRFESISTLLSGTGPLDLAVLALPPAPTPSAVRGLLAAGVRVLSEKPMSVDPAEIAELGRLADGRLGVVHNYRYRSDVLRARALLGTRDFGRVRFLRLERPDAGHFPGRGDEPDWRRRHAGSGSLVDNAYHWVYIAAELADSPVVRVTARLASPQDGGPADDLALLLLDHANGALTSVQAAWCAPHAQSVLEVHAESGSLHLTGDCGGCEAFGPAAPGIDHDDQGTDSPGSPPEPSYTAFYREVLDAVRADAPFGASPDECAEVVRVLEAAALAAREGRSVPVAPVSASLAG